jgi:mRNA interferase HicA
VTKRRDIDQKITETARRIGAQVSMVEGANHTKVWIGGVYFTIPRHREIPERLGRKIIKDLEDLR